MKVLSFVLSHFMKSLSIFSDSRLIIIKNEKTLSPTSSILSKIKNYSTNIKDLDEIRRNRLVKLIPPLIGPKLIEPRHVVKKRRHVPHVSINLLIHRLELHIIKIMRCIKIGLPRLMTYGCVMSVVIILLPLLLLDKFWYSYPLEAAAGNFIIYL